MLYFDTRACRQRIEKLRSEGIFTPPSLQGSVGLPGYAGGINWGGLAFDPASQTMVVNAMNIPTEVALIPREKLQAVKASGEFKN